MFRNGRYANVTATLALVVALGGTSFAAVTITGRNIKNGSVKNADLGTSSVTSTKVKDRSLLAKDFKAGQLPTGAKGDKGDTGLAGAPATKLFAAVLQDGTLSRTSGAVSSSRVSMGIYDVVFSRDITSCVYLANVGSDGGSLIPAAISTTPETPNTVRVRAISDTGAAYDRDFYLGVFC